MGTAMREPFDEVKKQEGYQAYQDAAARTPKAAYPWGTLLANVGGIAAAHALGYFTAGTLAKVLAESKLGARFARLPLATQRSAVAQAVGIAGSAGVVATGLAHMAGQMRVAREVSRLESERRAAGSEKVASVYEAYALALAERADE